MSEREEKTRGADLKTSEPASLILQGVGKRYPNGTKAVEDLSLTVYPGEVFGILGPNGAGKTTTILMLLGLTEPTEGAVKVLGMDPLRSPLKIKQVVGYMPDTVGFYEELTGFENLQYTARFLGLPTEEQQRRIEESLEKMGIAKVMHHRVKTYSHGMRRRLGLAEVLVKKPRIAILDEPTQGLDPESAAEFLDLLRDLKQQEGMTILLSSHLLDQVQEVCDRVGLFSQGRMVLCGTVEELSARFLGGRYLITLHAEGDDLKRRFSEVPGVHSVAENSPGEFRIECLEDLRSELAATANRHGKLYELTMHGHSLDSLYKTYFREVSHAIS